MRHIPRYVVRRGISAGDEITLTGEDAHHLARVVRRGEDAIVELVDGRGGLWRAVVRDPGPPSALTVREARRVPSESGVLLAVGSIERGRLDLIVEKATELGVDEVLVFASERARRVPEQDAWLQRLARLERVAEAALRQSGRARLPRLRGVVPLSEVIEEIPHGEGLIIDPRGDSSLAQTLASPRGARERTRLLVGPEAGFARSEIEDARSAGLGVCALGGAVLRSETAAIASAVLALAARGVLSSTQVGKEAGSQI